MAEKIKENQFDKVGVNPFNAPIPGESLTSSSDVPKSWERPPVYTKQDDCMEAIYMELTSDGTLEELVNLIDNKTPLDQIAQVVLYRGYTQGLWNPDLLLRLIEPTTYMILALAERALIDPVIYDDESIDDAVEEEDAIFGRMESFDKFKETVYKVFHLLDWAYTH